MTGCRNCEQRTDGDCGAHGPSASLGGALLGMAAPPFDTGAMHRAPLEAEIARLTAELAALRADRLPLDATAAAHVEAILRDYGAMFSALADVPPGTQRAIHGLWAELAAEREARAESEAREQRLRTAIGAVIVQSSERPDLAPLLRVFAEPTDATALRAHVAAAVAAEREACAAAEAREGRLREGLAMVHSCTAIGGDSACNACRAADRALAQPADDSALREHVASAVREHEKHVESFLSELYATLVDPLADGPLDVKEACAAILTAAREAREAAAKKETT